MSRSLFNRFDILVVVSIVVCGWAVDSIYSECNKHQKDTSKPAFCVMASDKCNPASAYCAGSQGAKEASKTYPCSLTGVNTHHCVVKPIGCGSWHYCIKGTNGGCTEGDAVKENIALIDKNTGEIVCDENGNPRYIERDKPYERQSALNTECPSDA